VAAAHEATTLETAPALTLADVERAKTVLAAQPEPSTFHLIAEHGNGDLAAGFVPPVPQGLGEHDLDPTDEQVDSFIAALPDHASAARAAQAAIDRAATGPHVFLEKFSCMVGPVMAHFKPNDVVTDFPLIMALRVENAPMVPVGDAPGMACCPACQTVFKLPRIIPARRAG
jgi:hypothetical protein